MQVSVETLNGLERKLTISVPSEKIAEEVSQRIKDLAGKVELKGFRPGKVPLHLVKSRYSQAVRMDVLKDMMDANYWEALKEKQLNPAGHPRFEFDEIEENKDFKYTATFEVLPQFEIKELDGAQVEVVESEVTAKDVDNTIDRLLEQSMEWHDVKRAVKKGDRVHVDFEGFVGDKPFEGGKAEGYELEIGSNALIPGFEDGIIGGSLDKPFDIKVNFPEDYGHAELSGKEALFKITVKKIMEGKKPALDDAFAEKFNIKDGGVEALKKDIKENMQRELERRVSSMYKQKLFEKLLEVNPFDVPSALVEGEIKQLQHEMYHRLYGPEHHDHEKIPDFPKELFEAQAKQRVQLGLLISEYVKKHKLVADEERVNLMIDKMASAYEKPEELRAHFQANKEEMAEVQALVLEDIVADKIASDAKLKTKTLSYDDVLNPKKEAEKTNKKEVKKDSKKASGKDTEKEGA